MVIISSWWFIDYLKFLLYVLYFPSFLFVFLDDGSEAPFSSKESTELCISLREEFSCCDL